MISGRRCSARGNAWSHSAWAFRTRRMGRPKRRTAGRRRPRGQQPVARFRGRPVARCRGREASAATRQARAARSRGFRPVPPPGLRRATRRATPLLVWPPLPPRPPSVTTTHQRLGARPRRLAPSLRHTRSRLRTDDRLPFVGRVVARLLRRARPPTPPSVERRRDLPRSPHISPYLPISPHISPYLRASGWRCLVGSQVSCQCGSDCHLTSSQRCGPWGGERGEEDPRPPRPPPARERARDQPRFLEVLGAGLARRSASAEPPRGGGGAPPPAPLPPRGPSPSPG